LLMRSGRTGSEATPLLDCAREGRPDRARGRLLYNRHARAGRAGDLGQGKLS
jgi:hypothetical protein